MYGSYYNYGGQQGMQQVGLSAQGAPINLMSGAQSGGTPEWQLPKVGELTGKAEGQDAYGALAASPDWLTNYYGEKQIKEGQSGYYDPNLQMRDMVSQFTPQIEQGMAQYGQNFYNPAFQKAGIEGLDPMSLLGNSGFNQNIGSWDFQGDYFNGFDNSQLDNSLGYLNHYMTHSKDAMKNAKSGASQGDRDFFARYGINNYDNGSFGDRYNLDQEMQNALGKARSEYDQISALQNQWRI